MTTTTTVNKFRYIGNGVTTVFAFPARIFSQENLIVEIIDHDTDDLIETLELTTDYTVSILGPESAQVTVSVAPTEDIQIRRETPQAQTLDLPTGTVFPAVTVENALDRAVAMIQDLQEQVDRKVGIPVTASGEAPDVIALLEDATEAAQGASMIAMAAQAAAEAAQTIAEDAADDAIAAAASVSLPVLGAANTALQVNAAGNTLEYGLIGVENLGGTVTAAGKALLDDVNASAQRTTLGLGSASTTSASDYATATQGALASTAVQPAALTAAVGVWAEYNKGIIVINSALSQNHGASLATIKDHDVQLECISVDQGYAVGDRVRMPFGTTQGVTVWINNTQIGASIGVSAVAIHPKTGSTWQNLDSSKWNVILRVMT